MELSKHEFSSMTDVGGNREVRYLCVLDSSWIIDLVSQSLMATSKDHGDIYLLNSENLLDLVGRCEHLIKELTKTLNKTIWNLHQS